MEVFVFAVFAFAAVASAVVVVGHRNPVYSTVSLVVTLLSTAVLFALLGSPFLAALQVLLYTGAILVLFLFVIMLLNIGRERPHPGGIPVQVWLAGVGALVLFGAMARLFWDAHSGDKVPTFDPAFVATRSLAELLFSTYLLPFEIIALLLLVAIVAASWVARRPDSSEEESR